MNKNGSGLVGPQVVSAVRRNLRGVCMSSRFTQSHVEGVVRITETYMAVSSAGSLLAATLLQIAQNNLRVVVSGSSTVSSCNWAD
jgi:hypothetical protein